MALRALVLALLVTAASAVFASAAMAEVELHSESSPVKIEGEQSEQLVLTVNSGTVKCTTAKFVGESSSTPTKETVFASSYSGCTAFGQKESTDCENCSYRTTWWGWTTDWQAEKHTVTATLCTVTLPSQSMTGLTFTNTGTGVNRKVVETIKATGLSYTEEGLGCASPGSHSNGTYTGKITYSGVEQGIWVE